MSEPCPSCGCPGEQYDGHVCEEFLLAAVRQLQELRERIVALQKVRSEATETLPSAFWDHWAEACEVFAEAAPLVGPLIEDWERRGRIEIAVRECLAAKADWERVSSMYVSEIIAERTELVEPPGDAPLEDRAAFGTALYAPYRARVTAAENELSAALTLPSGGSDAA